MTDQPHFEQPEQSDKESAEMWANYRHDEGDPFDFGPWPQPRPYPPSPPTTPEPQGGVPDTELVDHLMEIPDPSQSWEPDISAKAAMQAMIVQVAYVSTVADGSPGRPQPLSAPQREDEPDDVYGRRCENAARQSRLLGDAKRWGSRCAEELSGLTPEDARRVADHLIRRASNWGGAITFNYSHLGERDRDTSLALLNALCPKVYLKTATMLLGALWPAVGEFEYPTKEIAARFPHPSVHAAAAIAAAVLANPTPNRHRDHPNHLLRQASAQGQGFEIIDRLNEFDLAEA